MEGPKGRERKVMADCPPGKVRREIRAGSETRGGKVKADRPADGAGRSHSGNEDLLPQPEKRGAMSDLMAPREAA